MKVCVVIPAHNEEKFLAVTLKSLVEQTVRPDRLIVVNDQSTDGTEAIARQFTDTYSWIKFYNHTAYDPGTGMSHAPGSKVVSAFLAGMEQLEGEFDIICKYDADLIFPKNYMEQVIETFKENSKCGIAGGFCYIEKNGTWVMERLTGMDHIRGALKAYRKECYEAIGGLKTAMGWDTVDELLARYYGWEVTPLPQLAVKHLKPTGASYANKNGKEQGHAFRRLRYGWLLSRIASAKLAIRKNSIKYFFECLNGYAVYPDSFLVTKEEGKFIRKYRWKNIKKKLF